MAQLNKKLIDSQLRELIECYLKKQIERRAVEKSGLYRIRT